MPWSRWLQRWPRGKVSTSSPQSELLTTQEAAELLGSSRPTLVRLLEDSEISYEQRGRHRRVMLADLLTYQASTRRERREARGLQRHGGPPR